MPPPPSPRGPPQVALFKLNFLWPLSFDTVTPDTEFENLPKADGAKLTGISYSGAALIAYYSDGSVAYREGGGYSWSGATPLTAYIDPAKFPLQSVSGGSLHMVGLTKKGKVISAKSDSGVKTLRQLEPGVDTPACTAVSAGAWHVLGITEGGGLVAWAVSDCEEAKASVAPFIPIPVGAMPIVHMGGGALASAATVAVGAPRRWSFAGASHGRMRVTHATAGTVHSLLALSDGSVYVAGIKASQRFSRNMGISTLYIKDVQQIKLPVRSKQVLHAEACGSDLCCVVTDGGVVCWADEQKAYSSTDRSWSAEYAPVPRHVKELDKVAIKQIAVSDAYAMCAALAADGRIFLWCIKLSEKSWPAAWLNPQVAAVAPGAISIGWSCKDLYVCMPGGSTPADIKLCAARPEQ